MIRLNTLFKHVVYHPQEHQVLTTGTDRKIGYWETYDASMIRFLEGSLSGSVNSLDVSKNGKYFVSGGDDKLLKVEQFHYCFTSRMKIIDFLIFQRSGCTKMEK